MTSMGNMDPVKLAGRHHHATRLLTSKQQLKHSEEKQLLHRKVKVKAATGSEMTSVARRGKEKTATVNQGKTTPDNHKHQAAQPASPATHLRGQTLMTSEAHGNLDDDKKNDNDVTQPASGVGFGALLDKVCTVRLHGDITNKVTYSPRQTSKRALRFGDRLHTATEVVEIVVHGCEINNNNTGAQGIVITTTTTANNNNNNRVDTKEGDVVDENEAILLAAQASSFQRCQAWVGLHFDSDDVSSQSSTNR